MLEFFEIVKTKKGEVLAEYVNNGTNIPIRCLECNHVWSPTPSSVKNMNSWCPECAGNSTEAAERRFRENVENKKGTVIGEYVNSKTLIPVRCSEGHEWDASPKSVRLGRWCQECAGTGPEMTRRKFFNIVDKKGGKVLGTYINTQIKIEVECYYGHKWFPKPTYVNCNSWCPTCSGHSVEAAREDFYRAVTERGGEVIGEYFGSDIKTWVRCSCGNEWQATPICVRNGTWCPKCSGQCPIEAERTFREIVKENGGEVLGNYVNTHTHVEIKCQHGHIWSTTPHCIKDGHWCRKCSTSKGEAAIIKFLERRGTAYLHDVKFIPGSLLRTDFIIKIGRYTLIIEFDGEQHFREIPFFNKRDSLAERRERDLIKDEYCYDNGIHLLRVPYVALGYIDEIIQDAFDVISEDKYLITPCYSDYYDSYNNFYDSGIPYISFDFSTPLE